jgi:catechol 2,3-dioxygenase-like lactoylglutathione lyase family enzyme
MSVLTEPVKSSFHSVTPLIPTIGSMEEALAFYTEQMGFTVVWRGGNMAGIARARIAFNLIENDNQVWADNASFSISVSDLEALYQEYRHIAARVSALETKAWGRPEFHLVAPSGVCFQFYQHQSTEDNRNS